jgi:parallel beta-helix repeat protein
MTNIASENRVGVGIGDSSQMVVANNTARGNSGILFGRVSAGIGIGVVRSEVGVIRGNVVSNSSWLGVISGGNANVTILNNTVRAADREAGMLVTNPENQSVRSNVVTDNPVGIRVDGGVSELEVHENNIYGNGPGEGLDAGPAGGVVDAVGNWWGCPKGPDAAACDGVAGGVVYEPWLAQPNPSAGSGN